MPIEPSELATFLTKIHLFHNLSEEQIALVAAELEEESLAADVDVIVEGREGNSLFLIYSGSVRITHSGENDAVGALVKQDYFGELSLLTHRKTAATVTTLEPTVVLELSGGNFLQLIKKLPGLRQNFAAAFSSNKLASRLHFKWVRDDEVVYFLATKHSYRLVESLFLPVLSLLIPLGLLVVFLLFPVFIPLLW